MQSNNLLQTVRTQPVAAAVKMQSHSATAMSCQHKAEPTKDVKEVKLTLTTFFKKLLMKVIDTIKPVKQIHDP